jgi:hypothetical protein
VIHSPRKQVIIHELSTYSSPRELVKTVFGNAPPGSIGTLNWVDGVVLSFVPLPFTDFISKEVVEGRLHWDHAAIAPMPKYSASFELKGVTINVIDVTANETFRDIAKFFKQRLPKET